MSSAGAARRAAVPVSKARAEASRRNGAKSRGPKTLEGKARSSRNALKHGLRAHKHIVLPQEDAAEFAEFHAALMKDLAPVGALQTVLARRIAIAAWRLARADRLEAEVLDERGYDNASPGLALIRDGNGTRSMETLLRYRGAAMAEFTRSLRALQALQGQNRDTGAGLAAHASPSLEPNEPRKARRKNRLDSAQGSIAARGPAGVPRDIARPRPDQYDASGPLFGKLLEVLSSRVALESQTNPRKHVGITT